MARIQVENGTSIATRSQGIGDLLHRITDDVKTIATDELQLTKLEITRTVKTAATEAAVVVLGGIVALIGFAMLCVTAVVALAPLIHPLWLRLLIMAVVYLAAGGVVAAIFTKRLSHDAVPDMAIPVDEAKKTIDNVKHGLQG